jgi:Ca2+-binding RTX toxin-like protein
VLLGNDGNDKIMGGKGNDTLSGGAGQDSMLGEGGDDFMINFNFSTGANPDNDALSGGTGVNFDEPDPLDGPVTGIQNDYDSVDRSGKSHAPVALGGIRPLGVPAPLVINGTTGNDTIIINQNATTVSYTVNGVKTEVASSTVNQIVVNCDLGDDLVLTARPTDGANVVSLPTNILGDDGNDTISGGSNRDTIDGGPGNDSLIGNNGNDSLIGGLGSDILIGARGNDYLVGDTDSADTTGFGADDIHGNSGNDFVDYHGRNDPLRITMDDDIANDGGNNGAEGDNVHTDVENCLGGNGNDRIVGNNSSNFLSGSGGNDSLRGEGGIDKLIGNTGTDTLKGDSDIDLFFMSDGTADVFDTALDGAGHPITDFLNADNTVDVSLTSGRAVGTASA